MNEEFKKQVLKQLNRTIKELELLMTVEGSVTDIFELPHDFAETTAATLGFYNRAKKQIVDDSPRRRVVRRTYARPPVFTED